MTNKGHVSLSRRVFLGAVGSAVGGVLIVRAADRSPAMADPPAGGQPSFDRALRDLLKPDLVLTELETIVGPRFRLTFHEAVWTGGRTVLRDVWRKDDGVWVQVTDPDRRFDEQWVVLVSDLATPVDYYASADAHFVGFDGFSKDSVTEATLTSAAVGQALLSVTWDVSGSWPVASFQVTAEQAGQHVVGFQAMDIVERDQVEEVLCGARQHARAIGTAESLGAWELFAPMSLVQIEGPTTAGVFMPSAVLEFVHERELGVSEQPFGMSLLNESRQVQPVAYAPQGGGSGAELGVGDSLASSFGLCIEAMTLTETYEELARSEYGYTAYRRNVYGTSMTETVFNLIDLIGESAPSTVAGDFVPSPSGWWDRAKTFIDPEFNDTTKTTTAGVLLSAALLTGDMDFYRDRGRPMAEFHLSRENHSWSPIPGTMTTGSRSYTKLGSTPRGIAALSGLYALTKKASGGINELASRELRTPSRASVTPMSDPLHSWSFTGNPAHLARLHAEARRYVRQWMPRPYSDQVDDSGFGYYYSKAWTEVLLVYLETGDHELLDAAYVEARRFITQTQIRPVPDEDVVVPNDTVVLNQFDEWDSGQGIYDYPRTVVPTETVPAWTVSTSGLTFEQLTTYKISGTNPGGGFSLMPTWAPFLLELVESTQDTLLQDVAHNQVVGRWTSYPGYYSRQHIALPLQPDFPVQGPPGVSAIYYNHIPATLGMTINYLFAEIAQRSEGRIRFPGHFETNYAFFRFRVYGHEPGTVHGEEGIWPTLERESVSIDNAQINWISGRGNDAFYLTLSNEHETNQAVDVTFGPGVEATISDVELIAADGTTSTVSAVSRVVTATVPARSVLTLVVRAVTRAATFAGRPRSPAYRGELDWAFGQTASAEAVRAILLVRPDRNGYDAYVQIVGEVDTQLRYSIDGAAPVVEGRPYHPYEWTIPVEDTGATFTYNLLRDGQPVLAADRMLRLPATVSGVVPSGQVAEGDLSGPPDITPGDSYTLTAVVLAGPTGLTDVEVALTVPAGWAVVPAAGNPTSLDADEVAQWEFEVSVPAGDGVRATEVHAELTATEGAVTLEPQRVDVMDPLLLPAMVSDISVISAGGDSVEVSASVLNLGPTTLSGEIALAVPAGWTASDPSPSYVVPARSEVVVTATLTSPVGIAPGSAHTIRATLPNGQTGTVRVTVPSSDIVVDNLSPWPLYRETGYWNTTGFTGSFEGSSRWSETQGATARWTPHLEEAGRHAVDIWHPGNPSTTTTATYVVTHAGGTDVFSIDQQVATGQWRRLGLFEFEAGSSGSVELRFETIGIHRADAVRFVPAPIEPPALAAVLVSAVGSGGGTGDVDVTITAGNDPWEGDVAIAVPGGWTVSPVTEPLALAADQSTTMTFTVTVPASAADAVYEVRVQADGVAASSLAVPVGPVPAAGILRTDSTGYSESGTWTASGLRDYDGIAQTRYAGGTTGASATWTPVLPDDGLHLVEVWCPASTSSTARATYDLTVAAGTARTELDQRAVGVWKPIGVVELDAATVELTLTVTQSGHHRVGAARFTAVEAL